MDIVDPAELHRLAARLDEQAVRLREAGRSLGRAAETICWRSPAAAAFAVRCDELLRSTLVAADRLAAAGATLRTHARAADRIAAATRVEHEVVGVARAAGHVLGGLLS